jgi:hypothetical protein
MTIPHSQFSPQVWSCQLARIMRVITRRIGGKMRINSCHGLRLFIELNNLFVFSLTFRTQDILDLDRYCYSPEVDDLLLQNHDSGYQQ